MTVRQRTPKKTLLPRVKLWLEFDGEHVFCSGLCQILEAVARTGSIKEAALSLNKSYRYVWAKIKTAEAALGEPLVDAHVGGAGVRRSSLTSKGQGLVDYFRALQAEVHALMDQRRQAPQPPARGSA